MSSSIVIGVMLLSSMMVMIGSITAVTALPPPPGPLFTVHASDVDVQPFAADPSRQPFLAVKSWNGTVKSTGRPYSVYTAIVQDPSYMSIELPATGITDTNTFHLLHYV
jgi:hypothetical protein